MKQPLVFDIKRYAINDGPGIRLTIFFKGCPLSCKWCHNPEGISPEVQKMYTASKCIGAQDCIEICPNNALTLTSNGIVANYNSCNLCGLCAEVCPTKAIEMSGKNYEVSDLIQIIERERVHFEHSGGGVTFSGGEPLMHSEFLIKMLMVCGEKNIHRTVDTSGFAESKILLEVARHTDLFLYDLKLMDPENHKKWTGVNNKLILKNLTVLADTGANINIRIPLIKNVNSGVEELNEMAKFIFELPGKPIVVNLLPYHKIAANKYNKLGSVYNKLEMEEPDVEEQNLAVSIFKNFGIKVEIGG